MKIKSSFLIGLSGVMFVFCSPAEPREPWLSVTPSPGITLLGAAFGNGLFVAVGASGTIITSADGANWTARTAGEDQMVFYAVTFGDNGFVAVGGTTGSFSQPVVWTSPNGIAWTPCDVSSLNLTHGNWLQGVTFGKELYVAVGGNFVTNTIATSTNGIHWTARDSHLPNTGLTPLSGVAYGNGVFVAVGPWLLASTDGIEWIQPNSGGWYRLHAVSHAADRFVAVGPYSRICSTNGTNWLAGVPGTSEYLNGVTHGDGFFVCVGSSSSYSTNGQNWTRQNSGAPGNAIVYGNGIFLTVGNEGRVYRTMAGVHLAPQIGAVARLTLSGLVPGNCRIEAKSDVGDTTPWSVLETIPFTNSPTTWTDSSSTNQPARFYRAVWIP